MPKIPFNFSNRNSPPRIFSAFTAIILTLMVKAGPVFSAEIVISKSLEDGWTVKIDGPIEAGDSEVFITELESLIDEKGASDEYLQSANPTVLLNSPGNNLSEALKIAEIIHNFEYGSYGRSSAKGMPTVVSNDHECLSACAIIFMAGRWKLAGADWEISRTIRGNGKVGFHSPFLSISNGAFNKTDVERAYEAGLSSIRKIKHVLGPAMPDSLLIQTLVTPKKNFHYIDYVYEAILWDIDVADIDTKTIPTREGIVNVCHNSLTFREQIFDLFVSQLSDILRPGDEGYEWKFSEELGSENYYVDVSDRLTAIDIPYELVRTYWLETSSSPDEGGESNLTAGGDAALVSKPFQSTRRDQFRNEVINFGVPFSYMDETISTFCEVDWDDSGVEIRRGSSAPYRFSHAALFPPGTRIDQLSFRKFEN